ncbi:hypothetical protein GC102_10425 [Paenibacillus sp. LMG 31460]|uniref:F5/8 type C domain-containing protein n=1 Tax=Paenibacillus germinis TaxID=2654979 RepID=A0ABX1Z040_9BACL|nr:right-handed parallel beta-helix repeat-containing protein [Paenibacillus germinis]NOU86189.1 hypothetical protein [Paenibacillus germinis]
MGIRARSPWFKSLTALCLIAVSFSLLPSIGSTAHAEEAARIQYYVSPQGNDGNDGSMDHPFLTLGKARDTVRGINGNMDSDIVVYLRGGEYSATETLVLNETDSGMNGHNVIYRNYPGETPVISGGQKITGWTEENGIFKANVAGMKFRDLWINGERAVRARSQSYKIVSWDEPNKRINLNASTVSAWGGSLDPQLEIVINQHWIRNYSRLDGFQVQNGLVSLEMLEEAGNRLFADKYPDKAANQSIHFENSRLYLDEPGEWLLDETDSTVYYVPREGELPAALDARTGSVESFLHLKGSDKNNRIHNVTISGITFEYTKYQYPIDHDYVLPGQGGLTDGIYAGSRRQPAAILLEAADNVKLERNVIRHTGATAIDIRGSSSHNEVVGNAVLDIGGSGIFEGLFSESYASTKDPSLITKGNIIRNNYLNGISLTSCGVGIISGFSQDVLIEHNEIANADYSGISLGWGWTANDTSLMNNVVRNNNIYGVMKQLSDGAAIYTLSKTPNSQIVENYIHDIDSNEYASNYPVASIYLDQATWGYEIADNVLTRVGQTMYANVVADEGNTLRNNDSQNPDVINRAGLEPAYWDIVPGAELNHSGGNVTATGRGSFRISGTVASQNKTVVSILKNGQPTWSGNLDGQSPVNYNLNVDVEPGDVISFSMPDQVEWQSRIKPEAYFPQLVIDRIKFEGIKAEETQIDYRNRIMTVMANPDVDIRNLDLRAYSPPGTVLERVGGESRDYSSGATYQVRINDGSKSWIFEDGVKAKFWKLKVLRDVESTSVSGYNLANQLADTDNWSVQGGTKTVRTNSITFNGGYTLYQGKTFGNELLEFNLKTTSSGWPSLFFRAQDKSKDPIGTGSSGYITVITSQGIELQRFNNGVRTVFYGNIGGSPSKFGDVIPNVAFDFNKDNLVQVGALNTDEGVRLVMYINGKLVFDCVDTFEGKIEQSGYFGTYQANNTIKLSKAPVVFQLNDAIREAAGWYSSGGTAVATANSLTLNNGYAIYQGKTFQDEMLAFNLKTTSSGWPSLFFRAQDSGKDPIAAGSSGYITVITSQGIELQRFNDGVRTVFYGSIGGSPSKFGDVIPNTAFDFDKDNLVQVGAMNTDEGVRLVMYINGKLVFDCVDTFEGKIEQSGYFGTYQANNTIKLSKAPVVFQLNDAIRQAAGWHSTGGTAAATANSLTLNNGYTIYQGKTFQDEMLAFNLKTTSSGWPSVFFRAQDSGKDPIAAGSSGYITVITSQGIELQRFNGGVRTVFYGNIGGSPSKFGDVIPNTAFDFDKDNLVQVGALNTDEGVRLVMYINGKLVFDCVDTFEGKIEHSGYFGTYQANNTIKLSKIFEIGSGGAMDTKPLLSLEIGKAETTLSGAEIGNEYGQYPQWAQEYLQFMVAKAQISYDNAATTEAELQEALALLKSAESAFAKSQKVWSNVALGKTATSSEAKDILVGYGPDTVVDGIVSFGNGWSAESGVWADKPKLKPWLTIDLGASIPVKGVEVVARPNHGYDGERKTFQIQASNDPGFAAGSYTVLGEVGTTPFAGASWLLDVSGDQAYRYIRYAKTNIDYAFVSELRVFSPGAPETYSVGGTIKGDHGQPVSGAMISIYAYDEQEISLGTAITGQDGTYTLSPSQLSGKYLVKATGTGYEGSSAKIYVPYEDVSHADLILITAVPERSIDSVTTNLTAQKPDTMQLILVSVGTTNVEDDSPVNVELVTSEGASLTPAVSAQGKIRNDKAVVPVIVPDSVAAGSYSFKVTAANSSRNSAGYAISDAAPAATQAVSFYDGVAQTYTQEQLKSNGTIKTKGILFIPSSFGYQTNNGVRVDYSADQGIYIGAQITTKASGSDIQLRSALGPVVVDHAVLAASTGSNDITIQAGTDISARGTQFKTKNSGDTRLTANRTIDLTRADFVSGDIHLSAFDTTGSLITTNANFHGDIPIRTANHGSGVTNP